MSDAPVVPALTAPEAAVSEKPFTDALWKHYERSVLGLLGTKTRCMVHIQVVEANNLKSADPNGFSDPYFKLKIGNATEAKEKTPIFSMTLNPVYNTTMTFVLKDGKFESPLLVETLDYDKANSNDSLGFANIPLGDLKEKGWLAGWFTLNEKATAGGKRRPGRFYLRMVIDKDRSDIEKSKPGIYELIRTSLLEGVRKAEDERIHEQSQIFSPVPPASPNAAGAVAAAGGAISLSAVPEDTAAPAALESVGMPPVISPVFTMSVAPSLAASPSVGAAIVSPGGSVVGSGAVAVTPGGSEAPPAVVRDISRALSSSAQFAHCGVHSPGQLTLLDNGKARAVRLVCATWNVGNAPTSSPEDLRLWLQPGGDIYVVGTQENAYQPRKPYKTHLADFEAHLGAALGEDFELLRAESMGQIHVHVFGRRALRSVLDVAQVIKANEATGIANVGTNKGGTCVALTVLGTSLCFVSSHLAAHTTHTERRNSDMSEIAQGIKFKGMYGLTILNSFHHIFWMGDLNYRLDFAGDGKEPDEAKFAEMLQMINDGRYEELMQTDQLVACMARNEVFVGFNDCPPRFKPTFKVERDAVEPVYNPKRTPSYCDRVLWRSQTGFQSQVRLLDFYSANGVTSSDHKPAAAVFEVCAPGPVPAVDDSRGAATIKLHAIIANGLPSADLNGKSDPFIRFCSPWLNKGKPVETPHKPATLVPRWTAAELPPLPLEINNAERLHQFFIPFKIFDRDLTSETYLCGGVISLRDIDVSGRGAEKTVGVILQDKGGLICGQAAITLSLHFEEKTPLPDLETVMQIPQY
jgi:hypothetical protein